MDDPVNGIASHESLAAATTAQGTEIRGTLIHLTRFYATLEIYNPGLVLQTSEVLNDFQIFLNQQHVFEGKAVVRSLVTTGSMQLCEVSLGEGWFDVDVSKINSPDEGEWREQLSAFFKRWQKTYRIRPEYKVAVADMHTYFLELRSWIDQVELGIRASPSGDRAAIEQKILQSLSEPVLQIVEELFNRFEAACDGLGWQELAGHWAYMRRQMHPLVLCSPFAYRTFYKPLGYAGDYEIVDMMLRNPLEGSTMFAKLVNLAFLSTPPVKAHRNRIQYLAEKLRDEGLRVSIQGKMFRVFNVGCGPAREIDRFISETPLADQAHFTLLDFNPETLEYANRLLAMAIQKQGRKTTVQLIKKSVAHLLKESGRTVERAASEQYDFIYCAGLFDYLPDHICQRLMDLLYHRLAPNGLLLATNVSASNPLRFGMDHLLDWHLTYRTMSTAQRLRPAAAGSDGFSVTSDPSGVNLYIEVRKAGHD